MLLAFMLLHSLIITLEISIFISATCSVGLIGDDINAVTAEFVELTGRSIHNQKPILWHV